MTDAQLYHYRKLWQAARAVLRARGLSSAECEARRKQIHVEKLGRAVSSTALNNRQFDKVKGAFLAISNDTDLAAQERAEDGHRIRRRHVIAGLCRTLGYDDASLQGTIDRMQSEGRLREPDRPRGRDDSEAFDIERGRESIPRLLYAELREAELDNVIIALRLQVGRTAKQREAERIAPLLPF